MPPRLNNKTEAASEPFKKLSVEYGQFSDYFSKLLDSSMFHKSFLGTVELAKFQEITVFQHSQTSDEIVFGCDKFSSQRKLIILGVKSNLEDIETLFRQFCEYLWIHDNCSEIRISLVHYQIGDNLGVDSEFQKRIKSIGFRWISVNHSNQVRMTVFAIKRPLDTVVHKTNRRKQAYPVIIEHLTLFSLL